MGAHQAKHEVECDEHADNARQRMKRRIGERGNDAVVDLQREKRDRHGERARQYCGERHFDEQPGANGQRPGKEPRRSALALGFEGFYWVIKPDGESVGQRGAVHFARVAVARVEKPARAAHLAQYPRAGLVLDQRGEMALGEHVGPRRGKTDLRHPQMT